MSKRYEWINGETYCDSDQMYDNETGNKTQPVYVADLLNEQDQKIKDLEAKLAEERNKVVQKIRKKFPMPKDDIPDETTYSLNEFLDQIERGADD